jgi:hypothetical protein
VLPLPALAAIKTGLRIHKSLAPRGLLTIMQALVFGCLGQLFEAEAGLSAIHDAIGHLRTNQTKTGKLPYYFDANGGYRKKETLLKLLDHAEKIETLS